jgi:hypothetical protein
VLSAPQTSLTGQRGLVRKRRQCKRRFSQRRSQVTLHQRLRTKYADYPSDSVSIFVIVLPSR